MPNGVSCAYFAIRNHIYGHNEKNAFKEGIAGCQTVRTCDAVAKSSAFNHAVAKPVAGFLGKAAAFARKIVYPLIIASGVYNTLVSDDKVKTGAMQAGGIGTMYAFEQIAERSLNTVSKNILNTPFVKAHKSARYAVYIAKGLAFVASSLIGYDIGSNGAESIVNKIRNNKAKKSVVNKINNASSAKNVKQETSVKKNPFEDMQLK